jgi:hypothetical protein
MEMTEEPAKETEVGVLAARVDEGTFKVVVDLLKSGISKEEKEEISKLLVSPYCEGTNER